MQENKTILIVTNDTLLAHRLTEIFHANGYNVGVAADGDSAIDGISERDTDVVFVDTFLPDIFGNILIRKLRYLSPEIEIIYMADLLLTIPLALSNGATTSIQKPINMQQVLVVVNKFIEIKSLKRENLCLTVQLNLAKEKVQEYPEGYQINLN
jgi:two-component system, cell cycle response regulator